MEAISLDTDSAQPSVSEPDRARVTAILLGLALTPPMLDEVQLGWLYDLALLAPDGPGVEVGVFRGSSLATWGNAKKRVLFAIDDFKLHGAVMDAYERSEDILRENMQRVGLEVEIMAMPSLEAALYFSVGSLAFVFIDADHSKDGIGLDVLCWPQKVMLGGIIIFHDYGTGQPDRYVTQAVDQWQAEAGWEQLGIVGSAIAFRRTT
jgi:predicted O-methyltransferase YrrM